jgi:DNA polymerase-3 subunit delta
MQLAAAQLTAHLSKPLRPLYVVHGDEPLLAQEALDAIRATARERGHTERSVHTIMGAHVDWSSVLAAGAAQSLFADKQIVEVRIPSGKPGKDGSAALQQLAELARQGGGDTLWLITLPRLDKATKTGAWFSALDGAGVSVQIDPIERAALPAWLSKRLAAQGHQLQAGDAGQHALQFFCDRVEGNLLAAHQELQKLALLHPPGELTLAQIESAVLNVARYDVFKLSDAVLGGQLARAQRMLEGLRAEGEPEVLVHFALAEDIRALHRVQQAVAAGTPLPMALRENRIWGQRERLIERVLPQMSPKLLSKLLQAAHICDGIVKGLRHDDWPADPWLALQRLAFNLSLACQPKAARAAARPAG